MYGRDIERMIIGLFVAAGIGGAAIMATLAWGLPFLWEFVKPWIHAVTG